jgi:hypothetical protein
MNLPVSGRGQVAADPTRRELLPRGEAPLSVGRALLHRWQPGIGHALRMTIVIVVAGVPLVFWPAYFSQLEGLLVGGESHSAQTSRSSGARRRWQLRAARPP